MSNTISPISSPSRLEPTLHTSQIVPALAEPVYGDAPSARPMDATFSKPSLRPPLAEYQIIASLERLSVAGKAYLDVNMEELDRTESRFKELNAENALKLKEAAERMQQNDTWSMLKKAGACILAAISTVFGLSLLATGGGTLIAGALIASGILSIANLAFLETGVWNYVAEKLAKDNKEKQEKLKIVLPAVVGTLAAVLGFMGSAGAVIWAPLDFVQVAGSSALTAVNFAEGITTMGSAVAESKSLWSQAELAELEKKMTLNQFKLEHNATNFEKFMQTLSDASARASEIIKLSMTNYQKMLIQG